MSDNSHIDMDIVATLKEVMDDDFPILLETFVNDSSARLVALRQAISDGDADSLRRGSHSFKGSSSNIGAHHLAKLCERMEKKGLNNEWDGAGELLTHIEREYRAVEEVIGGL